jgi:beta-lactamase class A
MINIKLIKYSFTCFLLLFTLNILGQKSLQETQEDLVYSKKTYHNTKVALPLDLHKKIQPIKEIEDLYLQNALEKEINANKTWRRLVKGKQMSVAIVDLSDSTKFRYAGVNDNHMMYAASLPKIAILLAVMDAIDKGELDYTKEVKNDLRLMISKSNNRASTRNIDRVGYKKIESVLRAPKHKLYDEEVGGGLWVGKRYASAGKRYPDPIKGLSHAATTRQVCSFYYQLALGNLISSERSKEMLQIMKKPELHHKFVNTLDKVAPRADVYRKSGSWRNYHSDSALVWGPNRKYIIVALIDYDYGEQVIRDLVIPLEKVLKKSRSL